MMINNDIQTNKRPTNERRRRQLVDYHVTRTLARAQWEILGFGPYASLPRERRMEVG